MKPPMRLFPRVVVTLFPLVGLLAGCQRSISKDNSSGPVPATVVSVQAPAASAPAAPVFSVAAATSAVIPVKPTAPQDYSVEGLGELAADCVAPSVFLMAVPKNYYSSDTFDWRHVRQVALANPDFEVVPTLVPGSKATSIEFTENEHKPTNGVALVAHCKSSDTCRRFAAAYRTVVPSAKLTLICGPNPNIGPRITGGKSVLPTSGSISGVLPDKKDAQSQCVRLAACKAAKDHALASDESQECMQKPGGFKLYCSMKKTCEQVLACVGS